MHRAEVVSVLLHAAGAVDRFAAVHLLVVVEVLALERQVVLDGQAEAECLGLDFGRRGVFGAARSEGCK